MNYPRPSREQVFAALWELLKTATLPGTMTLKDSGRRLKNWDDVPPASQPAMFLKQAAQTNSQQYVGLSQWIWRASLLFYFRAEGNYFDEIDYPDGVVNEVIDAFEKVLDPVPGERQTLGELVYHCWIDGTVYFDDGITDEQGVILLPIAIRVGV